ncbi:MAG: PD-(D/E)XK nuclease family protein [Bacillota bacterium]
MNLERLQNTIKGIKSAYKDTSHEKRIAVKINNIKKNFVSNWKQENLPYVKKIVEKINPDQGIPVPVLTVCGKGTREIRFTKYLSYYLNPYNNHGLENKFLKTLLDRECKMKGFPDNWYKNCRVESEYYLGQITGENRKVAGKVDICIIGDNFVVLIEHKILSGESYHPETDSRQFKRYTRTVNRNEKLKDKQKLKILLNPTYFNLKKKYPDWEIITHREVINRGINLLQQESLSNAARENFIRLLMDLAAGPYGVKTNILEKIHELGIKLINKKFNFNRALKFERMIEKNNQIINILLER